MKFKFSQYKKFLTEAERKKFLDDVDKHLDPAFESLDAMFESLDALFDFDFDDDETEKVCEVPPKGWQCSREHGHDGPCAATPAGEKHPGTPGPQEEKRSPERKPTYARVVSDTEIAILDDDHDVIAVVPRLTDVKTRWSKTIWNAIRHLKNS